MSEPIQISPVTDALRDRPETPARLVTSKVPERPEATAQDTRTPVSRESANRAVDKLNAALVGAQTSLRFRVDNEADLLVVSIVDDQTGDVVQQMPAEDVVEAAKRVQRGDMHTLEIVA
ncbi:flagellar protein FlaG [Abyssibacter profundi]|uniref:Flagellar biosynthesis protein FlaG n=1 Tax=Abyssibacter profundi TaxID=2182787 RepID=A0A383XPJ6_9GAMM|nr:flagellar protein FlaG [Abyssibacter profundi]PWN54550.1 hypothetical protein DEH80_16905 [Abyssibacter profundi]